MDEWTITAKNASLEQTLKSNNLLAKVRVYYQSVFICLATETLWCGCCVAFLSRMYKGNHNIFLQNQHCTAIVLFSVQKFRELSKDFTVRCYAGDIEVKWSDVYIIVTVCGFLAKHT